MSTVPYASLSLDLDNEWSYLKTRDDPAWQSYPSYLPVVVPRFLDLLAGRGTTLTVFVVGFDAAQPENEPVFRSIAARGHEIGNHSYHHEPWLHTYDSDALEREIADSTQAIAAATGVRPHGFRGPGFSLSLATLETLARHGYAYDCSTLPTFIGPLARTYYFMTARISKEERARRKALFGSIAEGFRPLRPYRWLLPGAEIMEIPVTTLPLLRAPFHFSYVFFIAEKLGDAAALAYFGAALRACAASKIAPSLLLHPLDFMSGEDVPSLRFFPAMQMPLERKRALLDRLLAEVERRFEIVTVGEHAEAAFRNGGTRSILPRFP
ncbi:MAG: polysaccharide deacetylase family protein [Candidatus Baltobacteraceae bacterium]|jgi:peptidoglycan/xylan/chitin deacetylase (PgdA/CDA1 family)